MGRIWGVIFILLGAVWCWDGWRLQTTERPAAMFDDLGPDRYLMVLGLIMIMVGTALCLMPSQNLAKAYPNPGAFQWWPPPPPVTLTLALVAYTFALPKLGYTISTFLFFVLVFYLAGRRSRLANLTYGAVSTVIFYLLFAKLADMPLPVGPLGF